ncbi:MAG: esterase [Flavobacterium johnsoniae]|nr:MAG: esterase [Flavobacterium johnsoniae]
MKSFLTLLFSFAITFSFAQKTSPKTEPFVLGRIEKINSKVLNETRTLNIYIPDSYNKNPKTAYPVIYLLDGSANEDFIHVTGLVQFLTMIQKMPESIIVGIANVDRKRDFTFPTTNVQDKKDFPTTGHSEKFLSFVEKELLPYVKKQYRTSTATIAGQSLGGLFATEVLLKKPELFDNYIIISPSLWWDDESLLRKAPELLEKKRNKKIQVFVAVGSEGQQMEDDAFQLSEILAKSKDNLVSSFAKMTEENHLTILHNSLYKALEAINKTQ